MVGISATAVVLSLTRSALAERRRAGRARQAGARRSKRDPPRGQASASRPKPG